MDAVIMIWWRMVLPLMGTTVREVVTERMRASCW